MASSGPTSSSAIPGSQYADHARGNRELQAELRDIFRSRTSAEWVEFGGRVNTPIAPVNTPKTIADDPQFQARHAVAAARAALGTEQVPLPDQGGRRRPPRPDPRPRAGEHTDAVLRDVLGYDDGRITELREAGALG